MRDKVPVKYFTNREEFQEFLEKEKRWMYTRIVEAISLAFKNGRAEANIFEAKIEETMSTIVMNSEIEDWTHSLNLAIGWYQDLEEYEECARIKKLIDKIRTVLE